MANKTALELKMKLAGETTGMLGIILLNLGKKTGIWDAFKGGQPLTTGELSSKSGLSERYLEEWCRAAVLHGYLQYSCNSTEADKVTSRTWDSGIQVRGSERFSMSSEMQEVLFDETSPNYFGHKLLLPMFMCGQSYHELISAFKDDSGVPYTSYGKEFTEFVEKSHASLYQTETKHWLRHSSLNVISSRLDSTGGRVLDLGCGNGMSSISVAEAFPLVNVDAVDCDDASIEKAKINIKKAETKGSIKPGQVVPHCCMAHQANIPPASVDIVLVWIALHDMYNPSEVLDTVRSLLKPDGCVMVLEFANPDNFSELMSADPGSPEVAQLRGQTQFCYSVSTLHCLPVSKTEDPSQAIGTAISLSTMKIVASRAGFTSVTSFPACEGMSMYVLRTQ